MERRKFLGGVPFAIGGALAVGTSVSSAQSQPTSPYVNVKEYGAVGNGATDDTAAINQADVAATSMGATLHFPPGVYMINSSGIHMNGCSWTGDGQNSSVLRALPQTYTNLTGMVTATSLTDFRITGIGFDVSQATFPGGSGNPGNLYWAFQATNSTQWMVDHCAFTGIQAHTIALAVDGGSLFSIEDCYFNMPTPSSSYNQAINISVAAGPVGRHNVSHNVLIGSGLDSNGANGLIESNYVSGWKFGGGLTFGPLSTCIANQIINNVCVGGSGEDINSTYPCGIECWSAYTSIIGNMCSFNSGSGISVGNINTLVQGNVCFSNGQSPGASGAGIKMFSVSNFNASECVISGNQCFDTQATKTQLYGYMEAVVGGAGIFNNTVTGNNFNNNLSGTTSTVGTKMDFHGPQILVATAANPGTVAAGANFYATYTITGAALGDTVKVGFAADNQGVSIFGYVSAANTVTVAFVNSTGASKAFSLETLNIWVEKPAGYASLN